MKRTVDEIMNPELAYGRPESSDEIIRELILAYGITAVPILDKEHRPIGVMSLRDLVDPGKRGRRLSAPAATIAATASLEDAAKHFCESGTHHVVVVDDEGRAVGMLSIVDVLRAVRGVIVTHPRAFPHRDAELGVSWTHEGPLDAPHVRSLSNEPGIIVLSYGDAHTRETRVWAEATMHLRTRLENMLYVPQGSPRLAELLERGNLRFRVARMSNEAERNLAVERITSSFEHLPLPQPKAIAG